MKTATVKVSEIQHPPELQMRVSLSTEHIEELADVIRSGGNLPPVRVFKDSEGAYWLADGHHTLAAHKSAGKEDIECTLASGEMIDAQWAAIQANQTHGLKRTNADKERAIKFALSHPMSVDLSSNELARRLGVSDKTVAKVKDDLGIERQTYKRSTPEPDDEPDKTAELRKSEAIMQSSKNTDAKKSSGQASVSESLAAAQSDVNTLLEHTATLIDFTVKLLGVSKDAPTSLPYMANYTWSATVGQLKDFESALKRGMPVGGTPTKPVSQYQQDIKNKVKK